MFFLRTGFTNASGHVRNDLKHQERKQTREDLRGVGPSTLNHLDMKYDTLGECMKDAGFATAFNRKVAPWKGFTYSLE